MPIQLIFFNKELTTRRHAFVWVGIWLALFIATWFSRPLLPYQETRLAAITWEMFAHDQYLIPMLNGIYAEGVLPLVHWIQLGVWKVFGVSELSLRIITSFFSLGTLLLTGWAAYQLWPENREIRANAPLILIGSLMWTIFATANIEQVYFTFFSVLTINFLIRVWRFNEKKWWGGFTISLILGLFSSGFLFLIYILPIILLAPFWTKKYRDIYIYASISIALAALVFILWGVAVDLKYPQINILTILGLKSFFHQLGDSLPIYVYIANLVIILFPWILWLRLYKLYKEAGNNEQLRFCGLWFISLLIVAALTNSDSITSFFSAYPVLCLIIACIYKQRASSKKDIVLIVITMSLIGVLLIAIPLYYEFLGLPTWTKKISPLWGCGLILFSLTFFFNAKDTRIYTLALMSVALTLALNFGVVRQATDFYDLAPAGERIAWYQDHHITIAHEKRYQGQFHFVGRLTQPLFTIEKEDHEWFNDNFPEARIVLYVDEVTDIVKTYAEYWQPFRGKYLVITSIADAHYFN